MTKTVEFKQRETWVTVHGVRTLDYDHGSLVLNGLPYFNVSDVRIYMERR